MAIDEEIFDCIKLKARLAKQSCAKRYLSRNFITCSGCAVGAVHAGVKRDDVQVMLKDTCVRCQKKAQRLIKNKLCISCYNREREYLVGKDRRGKAPVNYTLGVFTVVVSDVWGEHCFVTKAASINEAMVLNLIAYKHHIAEHYLCRQQTEIQFDLFYS